jgi:hypothetical protein
MGKTPASNRPGTSPAYNNDIFLLIISDVSLFQNELPYETDADRLRSLGKEHH